MKANYSETFIDIIVSVNRRKVTIDFRFFLLHTANISCFPYHKYKLKNGAISFFRFVEPTKSQCHSTTKSWLNLEWDFWICRSNAATKLLIRLRTLTALNHSSSEISQRRGQIKVINGAST